MHAFLAASRRSDATLAALLFTRAIAFEGPTTLIRIAPAGAPRLADPYALPDKLSLKQFEAPDDEAAEAGFKLAATASIDGASVVLDLPGAALTDPRIGALGDKAFLAVGPDLMDEREAAALLVEAWPDVRAPIVAMGCSRDGGSQAATYFERTFAWAVTEAGGIPGSVASVVTPALNRREQDELLQFRADEHVLDVAAYVAAAIQGVVFKPVARAGRFSDVLRALADDLVSIDQHDAPTRRDLQGAPILDDWSYQTRPRRVLSGRVRNHPLIPDGRRIVTSDLYASDGRSYGRVLSRWYSLGRRAR